ncbi:putative metalloprotease [Martiniozyma asiatica (nom. inval.)]|nr:putative metalloprotease [Martiniozyma asiatica]
MSVSNADGVDKPSFGQPTTPEEISQCKSCDEFKNFSLNYNPSVIFMRQQIQQLGGFVPPNEIKCQICPTAKLGGFHPEHGIQLCANYLDDKWTTGDVLTHELIHWYDNSRFKVDWMNLRHHACSEIRAASLSGECRLMVEFGKMLMKVDVDTSAGNGGVGNNTGDIKVGAKKGGFRFAKGHQECVKRRAALSVVGHPKCKDMNHAKEIVEEVFTSCFNDTRPFEMIYR